jgi:hypothetical protein
MYHLVHVQVWQQSQCEISCPKCPLQIFRYEYPVRTTKLTLSYGSSEDSDHADSDIEVLMI